MSQTSVLSKLKKKLIVGVCIGALVYLAIVVIFGWSEISASLAEFNWLWFPVIILLTFTNYLFRFLKWDYYLGRLKIELPKSDSLIIFLSGLVMTISPGKIGELLKALFLKQRIGTPMSKSAPIVIAERLTDFVALAIIAVAGLLVFAVGDNYTVIMTAVVCILVGFVVVVGNRRFSLWIISLFEKMPVVGKSGPKLREAYDSIHLLVPGGLDVRVHRLLACSKYIWRESTGADRVFYLRTWYNHRRCEPWRIGSDGSDHDRSAVYRCCDGIGCDR